MPEDVPEGYIGCVVLAHAVLVEFGTVAVIAADMVAAGASPVVRNRGRTADHKEACDVPEGLVIEPKVGADGEGVKQNVTDV